MYKKTVSTRFTEAYKVKFPLVSAGMAFIASTSELALAVCKAGGIGSIGVGPMRPGDLRVIVKKMKKSTAKPFSVNFITNFLSDAHLQVCIEEKVPIVSFHFGHPSRQVITQLKNQHIKVWEQVGSVEAAILADKDGVDLIIAQGVEAGGHNLGTLPTFVLVPQVVEAVKNCMVLAAGGISNGKQVAAALCLGADGVWMGTRFVASKEAYAHLTYKKRLLEADGSDTVLTSIFGPEMPAFNPIRVIKNKVVEEFLEKEELVPADTSQEPVIGNTVLSGKIFTLRRFNNFPPTPTTEADMEEVPLLAGQGVGLIEDVLPAADIVHNLMEEALTMLMALQHAVK